MSIIRWILTVALVYSFNLYALDISLEPKYLKGYMWNGVMSATITLPQDYASSKDFIATAFKPKLLDKELTIENMELMANGKVKLMVKAKDPALLKTAQWNFFYGKDAYLLAHKKVKCAYLISLMSHHVEHTMPARHLLPITPKEELMRKKKLVEDYVTKYKLLEQYHQLECQIR